MKFLFVLFALVCSLDLSGQTKNDTIQIDKVEVLGQKTKPENVGIKTTTINSKILGHSQTVSLSELLTDNSTIHIKSMGR